MSLQDEVLGIAHKYLSRVSPSGPDNIMAVCPFHLKTDGSVEQHPSFAMSLTKGTYYCHSCHVKGNLKTFLSEIGVDGRTVHIQYGRILDSLSRNREQRESATIRSNPQQSALPESVLGLFNYCPLPLTDPSYADPSDRVYNEDLLRQMGIGFDIKHSRITFPLRDYQGNLIGISGRSTVGERPRYKIYTNEYEAYGLPKRTSIIKGDILWNYEKVYSQVHCKSHETKVVVVEGFKACLSVLSAGVASVALLGSHMTKAQHRLFERLGCTLYLMLDNDDAGKHGLVQMAPQLAKTGFVKIVPYEGRQPSGLNSAQVLEALDNASSYHIWRIRG